MQLDSLVLLDKLEIQDLRVHKDNLEHRVPLDMKERVDCRESGAWLGSRAQ